MESTGSRIDALTSPRTTDCLIKIPTVRKKKLLLHIRELLVDDIKIQLGV